VNRAVRKFSRPVRAVILAVLVHVAFGLLLGLSLSFKPQVIEPSVAKPVKAIVIDRSAIEQEEKRKAEAKKKHKAEAEKKRKKEAEKKRNAEAKKKHKAEAEKKRKAEAEKKRKAKAKKKRQAEEAREQEKQAAYSALGSLVGAIKRKIEGNWSNRLACSGQEVTISVKVNISGEVTAVKVVGDSGDDTCRRSAENAVYKASPLPFPDNPRFLKWLDQEFQIIFKPGI
jgi:colicin import membrane protein